MWKLVIEDDEGKRTVVPLTRELYTVGRKEGNTIRLTERNISREHAKLQRVLNGGRSSYFLEDCASYNGVYVNGLRVAQRHELQHGDLVQIGDYRMILQDESVTEEAPPPQMTEDAKATLPGGHVNRGSLLLERPNRFVMLAGPTPGAEYALERERITIGRAEECNISINHNSVSRVHCEVHSLGEGRFEIVDKGSSNGVRVNGNEIKRGIVEPGDVIELGDVRFKFVGAGQVFLPGVGDSQQLVAIGQRLAPERPKGSVFGWLALGAAVAAALLVGGWIFMNRREPPPLNPDLPQNREALAMAEAKKLCFERNDCDAAHDKLMVTISDGSPLRLSEDFKGIEMRWADGLLARADTETDEAKKRSMLRMVERATTVDDSRRKIASTKLKEMDAALEMHVSPDVSSVATIAPPSTKPTHAASTHATAPSGTGTRTKPPTQTLMEKASALYLAGDLQGARALLEPRVFAGKGSPEEVKFLDQVCKAQGDKACREAIKKLPGGS
jgi:pSer/pThr/pTyr-binding forkhead associated (FHA) protein